MRAEVSDRAGNSTVTQAKTEGIRPPPGTHEDLTTSISQPLPNSMVSSATPPFESTTTPATASRGNSAGGRKPGRNSLTAANRDNGSSDGTQNGFSTFGTSDTNNRGTQWPADHTSNVPLGRNPIPTNSAGDDFPAGATVAQRSDAFRLPGDPNNSSSTARGFDNSRGFENVSPPIRNQVLPSSPNYSTPNYTMLPAGERPRMVNSKSFDMDYEVDAVGPSGIAKVELWGTRDGGRTWTSYGIDNDNRSPIRVNVDGEGLYGFRIAVQSGSGLGGIALRSGDMPEVWVGVDLTKPQVRLTGAQAGEGPHAGELLIRWEASDAALASRPITLSFSDKPSGPWSIIAAGLENSGGYAWRPDNRVPQRIFLRIEARDEAGNTAIFDLPDPVPLERILPEGRIRGVRSVTDTASGGRLVTEYLTPLSERYTQRHARCRICFRFSLSRQNAGDSRRLRAVWRRAALEA